MEASDNIFKGIGPYSDVEPFLYRINTFKDIPDSARCLNTIKLARLIYSYDLKEQAVVCQSCSKIFKLSEIVTSNDSSCMSEFIVHHFGCHHENGKANGNLRTTTKATVSYNTSLKRLEHNASQCLVADQVDEFYDCRETFNPEAGGDHVDTSKDSANSSPPSKRIPLDDLCKMSDLLTKAVGRFNSTTNVKRNPPDFELLKSSKHIRLNTFLDWPSTSPVNPVNLAASGFYYIGTGDKVQCVYCKGALNHWVEGDVPETEHMKHFPDCQRCYHEEGSLSSERNESSAIGFEFPMAGRPNSAVSTEWPYLLQRNQPHRLERAEEEPPPALLLTDSDDDDVEEKDFIIEGAKARKPSFVKIRQRIDSFRDKLLPLGKTPQELAEGGFYHSGQDDNVRCFFCDIGLKNWRIEDEVWTEHARWMSQCKYLRKYKSQEFIQSCQSPRLQVAASAANNAPTSKAPPAASNTTSASGRPARPTVDRHRNVGRTSNSQVAASTAAAPAAAAAEHAQVESSATDAAAAAGTRSGSKRPFDMREVVSRLDTPQVQAMISIGFSQELIRLALQRRFETVGDDFRSNAELFDAIIEIENEQKQQQRSKNKNKREAATRAAAQSRDSGSSSHQTAASAATSSTSGANSRAPAEASSSSSSRARSSSNLSSAATTSNTSSAVRVNTGRESNSASSEGRDSRDSGTAAAAASGSAAASASAARDTATGGQDSESTNERNSAWQMIKKNKRTKKKKPGSGSNLQTTTLGVMASERSNSSSAGSRASPGRRAPSSSTGGGSMVVVSGAVPDDGSHAGGDDDDDDDDDDDVTTEPSAGGQRYSPEELEKLVQQYRDRLEDFNCRICMDRERDTVIMPCGHLVSCSECAAQLKICPMCRRTVRGTVRAFLS